MKKLFFSIFMALLSLSVFRHLLGNDPITIKGLLSAFSKLDLNFKNTKNMISTMKDTDFSFNLSSWENIFRTIKNFFLALTAPLWFLVSLLIDVCKMLFSVIEVVTDILGFDIFGDVSSGSGAGGGGGGIR